MALGHLGVKIFHIITALNQGGAEGALCRLVQATRGEVSHSVVSLLDEGRYGARLRELGASVATLNMRRGRMTPGGLWRLRRAIACARPHVVQTWMFHADLVGGLMAKLAGNPPVVWGIRQSNLDPKYSSLLTRLVVRACAASSRFIPVAVASCSHEAARVHRRNGYATRDMRVIPNGFDLATFKPDPVIRARVREELEVSPDQVLLGALARWDPQKDHSTLLRAIGALKARGVPFRLLLAGNEITPDNNSLSEILRCNRLTSETLLLGTRQDVPDLMNALDLHILASAYGEGFPNVVAEAMACGTPCVVTDVGDAAHIVGDTGWLVPPRNSARLADAIALAIAAVATSPAKELLAERCRRRVEENFSLEGMAAGFLDLWRSAVRVKG